MKKILFFISFVFTSFLALAQPPAGYYSSAEGLSGDALKVALHNKIKGHTKITYAQIWNAFWSTDNKGNGIVWDMYSDRPGGTPPYTFRLGDDQCGSGGYQQEGDCYNREHSWPQSWFKDDATAKTDMHHIFATDGYVNGRRNNYAYGEVGSVTWTSRNGSKLGACKTPGFSGMVFEPIDEYKGDLARAIMYMSVRYYSEDGSWGNSDMTTKSVIKPWAITMLLRWNNLDPVSQKEIDRNNAIYNDYQHNRNPFVDHPEYADMIWNPNWSVSSTSQEQLLVYPNPAQRGGTLCLRCLNKIDQVVICDITGKVLLREEVGGMDSVDLEISQELQQGLYFLRLYQEGRVVTNSKLLIN